MADAIVRVRDTGAGDGTAILRRIFEPFMQGDTTLDRSKRRPRASGSRSSRDSRRCTEDSR